jgi:hypothetical protein
MDWRPHSLNARLISAFFLSTTLLMLYISSPELGLLARRAERSGAHSQSSEHLADAPRRKFMPWCFVMRAPSDFAPDPRLHDSPGHDGGPL